MKKTNKTKRKKDAIPVCFICKEKIYTTVGEIRGTDPLFYHKRKCGHGTVVWFIYHPSEASLFLLFKSKETRNILKDFISKHDSSIKKICGKDLKRFVKYYKKMI